MTKLSRVFDGTSAPEKLAAGTRLPTEKELARQFDVSQPTMREVVRVLDAMGLIEVRHGSGAWVRGDGGRFLRASLETMLQLENVSILQVLDVRGVLGSDSAERAATTATQTDLDAIAAAYERLDAIGTLDSIDALIDAIGGFQVAVAQAAHNPLQSQLEHFLIDILLHLQLKVMRERGVSSWQKRARKFQSDRKAIAKAIAAHDPVAARTAMAAYLTHQRTTFLDDQELAQLRLADPLAVAIASELRYSNHTRTNGRSNAPVDRASAM
ncbi:FadR/GntR family transcriptional regulator [Gordonia humi]|uniref:FadR/GntR family transcriptional regulator n=1 Tax=Gordonia humi TaxID=686429 RepID=UPI003621FFA9